MNEPYDRRGLFGAVLESRRGGLVPYVRVRAGQPHRRMVRCLDVWPHDDGVRQPMLVVDLCEPLIRRRA